MNIVSKGKDKVFTSEDLGDGSPAHLSDDHWVSSQLHQVLCLHVELSMPVPSLSITVNRRSDSEEALADGRERPADARWSEGLAVQFQVVEAPNIHLALLCYSEGAFAAGDVPHRFI